VSESLPVEVGPRRDRDEEGPVVEHPSVGAIIYALTDATRSPPGIKIVGNEAPF
jgi:hypothetical protein